MIFGWNSRATAQRRAVLCAQVTATLLSMAPIDWPARQWKFTHAGNVYINLDVFPNTTEISGAKLVIHGHHWHRFGRLPVSRATLRMIVQSLKAVDLLNVMQAPKYERGAVTVYTGDKLAQTIHSPS